MVPTPWPPPGQPSGSPQPSPSSSLHYHKLTQPLLTLNNPLLTLSIYLLNLATTLLALATPLFNWPSGLRKVKVSSILIFQNKILSESA